MAAEKTFLTTLSDVYLKKWGWARWVHRARGDLDKAIAVLEKASALKPERAEIVYHLGVVYAEKGRTKEAIGVLNKALSLKPDFAGADDARQRIKALGKTSSGTGKDGG